MRATLLTLLLLVSTSLFSQNIYKIQYKLDIDIKNLEITDSGITNYYYDGNVVFGGSKDIFVNDENINKYVPRPSYSKKGKINIDSLDIPQELRNMVLEYTEGEKEVYAEPSYHDSVTEYERLYITEDTVYQFRGIQEPDTKVVFEKPKFDWKILTESKKIGEYNCIKATLNYYNRDYEVWFTPDIPLPIGPYYFGGLPGLIVKLKDSNNMYHFNLISVNKIDKMPKEDIRIKPKRISLKEVIDLQHKNLEKILYDTYGYDEDNLLWRDGFESWKDAVIEKINK